MQESSRVERRLRRTRSLKETTLPRRLAAKLAPLLQPSSPTELTALDVDPGSARQAKLTGKSVWVVAATRRCLVPPHHLRVAAGDGRFLRLVDNRGRI